MSRSGDWPRKCDRSVVERRGNEYRVRTGFAEPIHVRPGLDAPTGDEFDLWELVADRHQQWPRPRSGPAAYPSEIEDNQSPDTAPHRRSRDPESIPRVDRTPLRPTPKQPAALQVD